MKRVMCIPNYSEGRDLEKIEKIVECFRAKENVRLIDYQPDADHNRVVVEVIGEPSAVVKAVIESVKVAAQVIDMSTHQGAHPRMGAVDVIPFIPVTETTTAECVEYAKEVGKAIGDMGIPVYLYEDAATKPERTNLASIRKGQYEGFFDKIKDSEWKPDFGPAEMNAKSGVTAVGARFHLVAFNVNLNTPNLEVADKIAKKVRFIGGGLRFVKAIGLELKEKNQVQVSMNLVNFEKTAIYQALEMVKSEARRYGVSVANTELIGLLPLQALIDSAAYYMQIEDLKAEQVLETLLIGE
ncbi:glutamate formimidoyltransferase [Treponema phagedenis]|uniref:glutamate formimidoyltransferase n=1 Tax=Treponema phagedenis TaxID=162 RepID=A0A0B7GVZ6_TREPH|nr:glutamate formimidoyltransferase [Treponema phagedenis]EFW37443.1 glutamate formimidoyltransferase [Treponema phagedenis F0421]NVP24794.1 glutamate formimidoyltransferase [Treponema phagedenis]QEJ95903.1 glutamate formimidoyltransferase [Treponema phagedenis]QEJ98907.1 glutamate formimidoyltransferase [Treponema phagedenis]QEK04416.1 glutamate formimidoyltransferase [Treponema phagedenis]